MFFHTLNQCTHTCAILLLMTKMEVSWKYDIQNGLTIWKTVITKTIMVAPRNWLVQIWRLRHL
jgi:hypothetical protein